jgi:hypothetical protein
MPRILSISPISLKIMNRSPNYLTQFLIAEVLTKLVFIFCKSNCVGLAENKNQQFFFAVKRSRRERFTAKKKKISQNSNCWDNQHKRCALPSVMPEKAPSLRNPQQNRPLTLRFFLTHTLNSSFRHKIKI